MPCPPFETIFHIKPVLVSPIQRDQLFTQACLIHDLGEVGQGRQEDIVVTGFEHAWRQHSTVESRGQLTRSVWGWSCLD